MLPFLKSCVGFNKDLRDALLCQQKNNSGAVIRSMQWPSRWRVLIKALLVPLRPFLSGLSQREFLLDKEKIQCQGVGVLY